MSENLSLFGDEQRPNDPSTGPTLIADWVVRRLREALDAKGLISMGQRQEAIESAAGRPVESLRALTYEEGLRVLSVLGDRGKAESTADLAAWDERDEDTWIDRQ